VQGERGGGDQPMKVLLSRWQFGVTITYPDREGRLDEN
jgi:hypothetical protein